VHIMFMLYFFRLVAYVVGLYLFGYYALTSNLYLSVYKFLKHFLYVFSGLFLGFKLNSDLCLNFRSVYNFGTALFLAHFVFSHILT